MLQGCVLIVMIMVLISGGICKRCTGEGNLRQTVHVAGGQNQLQYQGMGERGYGVWGMEHEESNSPTGKELNQEESDGCAGHLWLRDI